MKKRDQIEQEIVEYAMSVDWDFNKVAEFIGEEMNYFDYTRCIGEYSKEKTEYIFNKYNHK